MADVKKTKAQADFQALDAKELTSKVAELKKQLVEQHRALAAQELPNPNVLRKTRKDIARALTALRHKAKAPAATKEEK